MRRWARRWLVAVGTALAVLSVATPAFAHASLESSAPASGAQLASSPTTITLRFNEGIGIPAGALRLYDAQGRTVALSAIGHGPQGSAGLAATLTKALPNGLYVVAWRAISADSHPVSGAYTFTVGPAGGVDPGSVVRSVLASERPDTVVAWIAGAARTTWFAALALVIGVVSFPLVAGMARHRRWSRWLRATTAGAGVAAVVSFATTVPAAAGAHLRAVGSVAAWRALAGTTAGTASLVRIGALALMTLCAGARPGRWRDRATEAALAVAVVASSWAGHGGTGRLVVLGVGVTVVHTLAMGVWLGGLVVLAVLVLDRRELAASSADVDTAWTQVQRFSTAAFAAVVVLAVSGLVQSWRQLGTGGRWWSMSTYLHTGYGRDLGIKVMAVAVMVAVAAFSRRVVQGRWFSRRSTEPTCSDVAQLPTPGPESATADVVDDDPWWRRSLQLKVLAEMVIGAIVLAVTAALVVANPNASAQGAGSVSRTVGDSTVVVSLFIEPARAGRDQIHLGARSADFGADVYPDLTLQATLPSRQIGPLDVALTATGTNHWVATAAQFPYPGTWTLTVAVTINDFDRRVFTVKVHIAS